MTFESCALVLLGGFFGGIARFFVSGFVGRRIGETFPWGTLVVNVSGALVIGALAGLARSRGGGFSGGMFLDLGFVGLLAGCSPPSRVPMAGCSSVRQVGSSSRGAFADASPRFQQ